MLLAGMAPTFESHDGELYENKTLECRINDMHSRRAMTGCSVTLTFYVVYLSQHIVRMLDPLIRRCLGRLLSFGLFILRLNVRDQLENTFDEFIECHPSFCLQALLFDRLVLHD